MSDYINVQFLADVSGVAEKLGNLSYKTPQIAARAINESSKTAVRWLAQETVKIYDIRQKDVTESLSHIGHATASRPYVRIRFDGVHKNLFDLRSSRSGNSLVSPRREVHGTNPQWVRTRVMKGHAMTPLRRRARPFVRTATTGHQALFVRTRDIPGLEDIRGVSGPAVPQELKNEKVWEPVRQKLEDKMVKRAEHYIDRALKGY